LKNELEVNKSKAEQLKVSLDPHISTIEEYYKLQEEASKTKKAKKRKEIENKINDIKSSSKMFDHYVKSWKQLEKTLKEIEGIQREIRDYIEFFESQTKKFISLLSQFEFITRKEDEEKITISEKGVHASNIQEVHCLCLADILSSTNNFEDFSVNDIVAYLSIFCDIKIKDDIRISSPDSITFENKRVYDAIVLTSSKLNEYTDYATSLQLYQNVKEENLCYDLIYSVYQWCEASTEEECRGILFTLQNNYEVFNGEFIKSILKINNVTSELTKVCENSQLVSLQHKLSKISGLTLKFIATNQSLYL